MADRTRVDKFGRVYKISGLKDNKTKKAKVGYVEIGDVLYKVDVYPIKAGKKNEKGISHWLRVTKLPPKEEFSSGGSF